MIRLIRLVALFALLCHAPCPAVAWYPPAGEAIPDDADATTVVGANQVGFVGKNDSLVTLARGSGLGFQALAAANPGVDAWLPEAGHPLILPYSAVLPAPPRTGITINLAELRLYLITREEGLLRVRIYPIGVGDEGWETPEGEFSVLRKVARPGWTPPASIRRDRPELPPQVPPGPDNPLGEYWLGFSQEGHGIHGTNQPYGVGRRVSHGCIRLYPEDIRDLYRRVEVGTPVWILYRPIKVGVREGVLTLEVHHDYLKLVADGVAEAQRQARALGREGELDLGVVRRVVAEARGIPLPVSAGRSTAAVR